MEMIPQMIAHPSILIEISRLVRKRKRNSSNPYKLSNRLNTKHIEALAIWRHCYAFTWKQGDVLIFDNLQMLHTGMPGWGSRELRVMLCNPVALPYSVGPGAVEVSPDDKHLSGDERLRLASAGKN